MIFVLFEKGFAMTTLDIDIKKLELLQGAKFLHAYMECSDAIQASVRELLEVVIDPETDEDDREMTLFTLADCLFPNFHNGELGMELEESERMGAEYSDEMRQDIEVLDSEEASFADRLKQQMTAKGLTQEALAELVGVHQSAISNMLNRQCRPQQRTIERFATALGVERSELWPG